MFIRTPSPNLQIVRAKSFLIEAGDPSDADLIQKVLRVIHFVAASTQNSKECRPEVL